MIPAIRKPGRSHGQAAMQNCSFFRLYLLASGDGQEVMTPSMVKAVLTDAHFWVPVIVLVVGLILLLWLH
jgi:hypothetical protein